MGRPALDHNLLSWKAAGDKSPDFEVQRSSDGINFKSIAKIKSRNSARSSIQEYSYADRDIHEKKYFYRIRTNEPGGNYLYSNIILIENKTLTGVKIFPTISIQDQINIRSITESGTVKITLSDLEGRILIMKNQISIKAGQTLDFRINRGQIPPGIYHFIVETQHGRKIVQRIILN